jgi:DNA-binding CsgD family transcriptional regulator/pimeloyl-ACP methyl ester carboxylesterase
MDPPPVQYVTTSDGMRIAYGVSGSGIPLIFLPGVFYHVQIAWEYQGLLDWLLRLADRFQVIQLDPRGTGLSSREVGANLARDHYQRDLEAVVNRLRLDRFLILGASFGVDLAVDYALQHPEEVIALMFGTSGTGRSANAIFEMLPAQDWDVFVHSVVPRDRSQEDRQKIVNLTKQASDQRNYLLRRRVLGVAGEIETRLSNVRPPTLVMHSREYAYTPVEEGMKIAQLTGGQLVLLDGSDPWGDSDQGMRAIATFLDDVLPKHIQHAKLVSGLSPREVEVLRLLAAGRSNQQIADELVLSLFTVNRHVSNIYSKTGVANRAEAASFANRRGLV